MTARSIIITAEMKTSMGTETLKEDCKDRMTYKQIIQKGMMKMMNISRAVNVAVFFIFIMGVPGSCPGMEAKNVPDIGLIRPEAVHKGTGSYTILDGRPVSVWKKEHIPGALSFSWESYTRTDEKKIDYRMLPPEMLADILGKMGIDAHSKIFVYGDMDTSWGGEAWTVWLLSFLGHKGPIRLMAGGIDAWKNAGYPVISGSSNTEKTTPKFYQTDLRGELIISAKDIDQMKNDVFIVDTRSFREWITGNRLPGAVHINWEGFYTGPDKAPIDANALSLLLKKNGVTFDKPVIYYCTGGIRSSLAWLTHQLAGKGKAVNFEGGTEEWKRYSK